MRGTRSKAYRKLMHQYALTFKFREPYQVLCTPFCSSHIVGASRN